MDYFDIKKAQFIVCFDRSYKDVRQMYLDAGVFKIKDLVGLDTVDLISQFLLTNITYTLEQIFTNDNAKSVAWGKLVFFVNNYRDMRPQGTQIEQEEVVPEPEKPAQTLPVEQPAVEEMAVKVDVQSLVNKLAECIDLSDPALGKTLSLSSRIELTTPTGNIVIYPVGGRIPKQDGVNAHLSIKDTIALLKTCLVFNATTISFHLKE